MLITDKKGEKNVNISSGAGGGGLKTMIEWKGVLIMS